MKEYGNHEGIPGSAQITIKLIIINKINDYSIFVYTFISTLKNRLNQNNDIILRTFKRLTEIELK